MRNKIISYFIGEPEEITLNQELLFYGIMAFPFLIALFTFILS